MNFTVQHRTSFVYDAIVYESINEAYLCPVSNDFQVCHSFDLDIQPAGSNILRRIDFYTNQVHHFELIEPHDRLDVVARSTVETFPDVRDFTVFSDASLLPNLIRDESTYDFLNASERIHLVPMIIHEAREIAGEFSDVRQAVELLMGFVYHEFTYRPGATAVDTRVDQVFAQREGVCQDFAHVMIALCRGLGIPARYVSGYFYAGSAGAGTADDNTESHAWVDCFLPQIGWVAYDPTHNRRAGEQYIKVAVGRDYRDVRPVSGTFRGKARAEMEVSVDVQLTEPPS